MESGLQQAEQSFKSMLSDEPIDKQQQLNEEPEEAEVEIEEEEPEIEAEADSEEIEAEDEEPEDEESQPQKYHRVKLDGEEFEITTEEALAGYQRQQDYTKKTQQIAEQKRQFKRNRSKRNKKGCSISNS